MEGIEPIHLINTHETPDVHVEPKIKPKNTKNALYICSACGYQNKSLFEYQKHLSRLKPCAPGPELDKWVLNKSKNRLSELLLEFDETPKIKRHKKRLTLLVKYIRKLVLVIRNMEHIEDMQEYEKCLESLQEQLSSIR